MHAALLEGIRSIPQVDAAAMSTQFPLNGASWTQGVRVPRAGEEQRGASKFTYVSPNHFRTMGIRILAGRDVDERDVATSPKVLVVYEAFARGLCAGAARGASRFHAGVTLRAE